MTDDSWRAGASYESYMGRWSRPVAAQFVAWLGPAPGLDWLDIGCGTGALSETILAGATPRSLVGVDQAEGFVSHARHHISAGRAKFEVGSAGALPLPDSSVDVTVSALAYNFFPDRPAALAEMRRALRPGGVAALYIWDYPGGGMQFIDEFWKAAQALDPRAAQFDEAARFPFCTDEALHAEFVTAGFEEVKTRAIETETVFQDFDDLWRPFTLGTGPAPAYLSNLGEDGGAALQDALRKRLGRSGPIRLSARAWAVRGRSP
jgi:ubiquinone/menaquinone biosynthesis C-methylase UbiE